MVKHEATHKKSPDNNNHINNRNPYNIFLLLFISFWDASGLEGKKEDSVPCIE